ncbi:MAG: hypothetical protein ABW148_18685 [Sedimenticola sp.]
MASNRYLDLGNAVVPLIAKLNGTTIDDRVMEWIPFTTDSSGNLITTTYYETIDSALLNRPFVLDTSEPQFNISVGNFGLLVGNVEYLYDPYEDEFNRKSGNYTLELVSGTFSTSQTSSLIKNNNHRGGHFVIEITGIETDATITPILIGVDLDGGGFYDILVGTKLTAEGVYILKVYPGIGQIPNGSASDILPNASRLRFIYGGTGTITYSSSCSLIL